MQICKNCVNFDLKPVCFVIKAVILVWSFYYKCAGGQNYVYLCF